MDNSRKLSQTGAANWLLRQWNDIKGNVKFWILITVMPLLLKAAIVLTSGIPLWRRITVGTVFLIVLVWAVWASFAAARRSTVLVPSTSSENNRLERLLSTSVKSRLVKGYDALYAEAAKLIPSANRSIKTLLVGVSTPAPPSLAGAISEHLRHNHSVSYEVLLCVDFATFDEEFWDRNKKRRDFYSSAGVLDRVVLRALNTKRPVGFDVLVIDNIHSCLAFSPVAGTSLRREACIIFEAQPEIAQHLADWIDKAKTDSVDFLDAERRWRREHQRSTKSTAKDAI